MRRLLSFLLVAFMLFSCISCSKQGDKQDTESHIGTTGSESSKSGVPEGTDFNKENIKIWYTTTPSAAAESFVDLNPDFSSGDKVEKAMFELNDTVETRLNVVLDYENTGVDSSNVGNAIERLILAGDDTYDVFNIIEWNCAELAAEGIFLDVSDMPYLSFDEEWWDYEYMKEMTIGDRIFCLVGDYSIDRTRTLNCMYYNKQQYGELFGNADGLYEEVKAGFWTIDRMIEISAAAFHDINGDTVTDFDDGIGLFLNKDNLLDGFFYGSALKVTKRNSDDVPEYSLYSQKASDLCEKVMDLVDGKYRGVYTIPEAYDHMKTFECVVKFSTGKGLLLPGFFYTAENLRNMSVDYGIIPYPKYDSEQEDYYSIVHNIIRSMVLPITCQKPQTVCAVLEEMSYEGNNTVLPVYYESTLKLKYSKDILSGQMIDIIRKGCVTDFALIYPNACNKLGLTLRQMAQGDKKDLASFYYGREQAAKNSLKDFIDGYLN